MKQDFGSGLSVDDLIGLPAGRIRSLSLPNEAVFRSLKQSAEILVDREKDYFLLAELWGDGYSVWRGREESDVLQITPTGQVVPMACDG
ncbi:hypothetical protein KQH62_01890 [bacterium]|nr:hypothetical protein [bacterium]